MLNRVPSSLARRGLGNGAMTPADDEAASVAAPRITQLFELVRPELLERLAPADARRLPRKDLAGRVSDIVIDVLDADDDADAPSLTEQRRVVALAVDYLLTTEGEKPAALPAGPATDLPPARPAAGTTVRASQSASKATLEEAKRKVKPLVLERIDVGAASALDYGALIRELSGVVAEIREELKVHLNHNEHNELVTALVDDMVGLGPLESLLADNSVSDIMVNGADQVYVERGGRLELTDVRFQDNNHVMSIATRIVTRIGRRIDESNPICDARLADGSRVNVIAPPLAIDGPSISIRKFSKKSLSLDNMARSNTMSQKMAMLLKIAARSRLNILISGGTGSGKTTLLNALSQLIDPGERVVTIEDAAELQLQQPHVVRLETRPPNLEGKGEVTMRGLVKNSLRMRPDRIILGEVRGAEAVDMLQAMNTGHEGSMCTIHANKPRDALTRLDNMVGMAGINLPAKAVRTQIASAVDIIVQASRMRDGVRRVAAVTEVVGMEGDVIITQDLFTYEFHGEDDRGKLKGSFRSTGVRPHFTPKAEYFGLRSDVDGNHVMDLFNQEIAGIPVAIAVLLVFLIVLFFFVSLVVSEGTANRRQLDQRVGRVITRYRPSSNAASAVASLRPKSSETSTDKVLAKLVPNQKEMNLRLQRTGRNMSITNYITACVVIWAIVAAPISTWSPDCHQRSQLLLVSSSVCWCPT